MSMIAAEDIQREFHLRATSPWIRLLAVDCWPAHGEARTELAHLDEKDVEDSRLN
jgi:hypothetical protein